MKKKIYKYLYHNKSQKYIDAVPDLVAGYNSNFHSSIKQASNTVTNKNESEVWAEQYMSEPSEVPQKVMLKFSPGQYVNQQF